MKTTETLVKDIYDLMSTKQIPDGVDGDKAIEDFVEAVKTLMKKEFTEYREDKRTLRMSNIGRSDKYLWHHVNGTSGEVIKPHTYIKFMYGHLIEEMLLCLTKLAGHTVTDEQKQCEVEGITGHMDCKIDGVVTDIKSASSYSFKKFQDRSLAINDPFGYIDQIKGYAHACDSREFGWLAMDKQNGHLTYLKYDLDNEADPMYEFYSTDIVERIKHIKKLVAQPSPPELLCHDLLEDGKSGNLKLAAGCSYCPFKTECFPELRGFYYSTGVKWLAHVEKEPQVPELMVRGGEDDEGF